MSAAVIEEIRSRRMTGESDFWAVHRLLVETQPITPVGFNWEIRRWEGQRFYHAAPGAGDDWAENGRLWLTASGQLIGAVHQEGSPWAAHLQVHPNYRHLESEMIAWAENHIIHKTETGKKQVQFFVYEYDAHRQAILASRGYQKMAYGGVTRHLRLGQQPLAEPQFAAGYKMRITNGEDIEDCQKIADLLNAAFNRSIHTAAEYQAFTHRAPCFRQDLDLVAVAPDGTFASYVGIPYDAANKLGIFEPICTHPDHRQRGLGKALMQEGLLRLKALGAVDATVETGDQIPANKLYNSIGFTERYKGFYWKKARTD